MTALEWVERKLRSLKWRTVASLIGPWGTTAAAASIPRGERVWEYPWALRTVGRIAPSAKPTVLEVGCSPSSLMPLWLAAQGFEVWGADLRPYFRELTGFRFVCGDITDSLKIPFQHFDITLAISVFEHVGIGLYPGDQEQEGKDREFLKALARFTQPFGKILLTIPMGIAAYTPRNRIDACRIRDQESLELVVAEAGLKIESQECVRLSQGGFWSACTPQEASAVRSDDQVRALAGLVLTPESETSCLCEI